jgi:hypothetical protein
MCRRIQCEYCHKPSFAGCGKHVDQVLRGVPDAERCHCSRNASLQNALARHGQSQAKDTVTSATR